MNVSPCRDYTAQRRVEAYADTLGEVVHTSLNPAGILHFLGRKHRVSLVPRSTLCWVVKSLWDSPNDQFLARILKQSLCPSVMTDARQEAGGLDGPPSGRGQFCPLSAYR